MIDFPLVGQKLFGIMTKQQQTIRIQPFPSQKSKFITPPQLQTSLITTTESSPLSPNKPIGRFIRIVKRCLFNEAFSPSRGELLSELSPSALSLPRSFDVCIISVFLLPKELLLPYFNQYHVQLSKSSFIWNTLGALSCD